MWLVAMPLAPLLFACSADANRDQAQDSAVSSSVSSSTTAQAATAGPTTAPATAVVAPIIDDSDLTSTDPAARVRAAARATATAPWVAVTVAVPSFNHEPAIMIYRNGVASGCTTPPQGAGYTYAALVQDLGSIQDVVETQAGVFDPGGGAGAAFFYDVRLDEKGRLASASWYGGELATFFTFAFDVDPNLVSSCPGVTGPPAAEASGPPPLPRSGPGTRPSSPPAGR